jgi:hypothetical protein
MKSETDNVKRYSPVVDGIPAMEPVLSFTVIPGGRFPWGAKTYGEVPPLTEGTTL